MKNSELSLDKASEMMFDSMKKLGYSDRTIESYRQIYKRFSDFATVEGCTTLTDEIIDSYIADFARRHDDGSKKSRKRIVEVHRLLDLLQDCVIHGAIFRHKLSSRRYLEPYKEEMDAFRSFAKEKGLSDASVERICHVLDKLISFILQRDIKSFSDLFPNDIKDFIKTLSGYSRKTMSTCMYSLRVFTCFLNESEINKRIDGSEIPRIKYVSRRSMPKIWSDDECKKVLSVVDTGTAKGKRDYAILMLAINVGMRQIDILNLRYENINWKDHTISYVQKKTGLSNRLYLDEATGWAIIDYIKNGRPDNCDCNYIFLRHASPYVPLESFYTTLTRYLKLADIHVNPETMHGMHSLRHSLASRMLRKDIPIGTIADIMGHANIQSTNDYLQIDTDHLRECALEVDI